MRSKLENTFQVGSKFDHAETMRQPSETSLSSAADLIARHLGPPVLLLLAGRCELPRRLGHGDLVLAAEEAVVDAALERERVDRVRDRDLAPAVGSATTKGNSLCSFGKKM